MTQRHEAETVIRAVLRASDPARAVQQCVSQLPPCAAGGRTLVLAVGKAACTMAAAALLTEGFAADEVLIVTKYGHAASGWPAQLPAALRARLRIREAGHPVSDANSYAAAEEAMAMVRGLSAADRVVLLVSGGGSALLEKPLLPPAELEQINRQLFACGAQIGEINTIRKRLSAVKGGRFACLCEPAGVVTIALSDVLSDAPDQIASGPGCADPTTCGEALAIAEKYSLSLSPQAWQLLARETPKALPHTAVRIVGSVRLARQAAARACRALGYSTCVFTPLLTCQAEEAGRFFGALARRLQRKGKNLAVVAGGETVVSLPRRHGMGGRNQQAALAAALALQGLAECSFFSLGTDGTDGPTDAAGGFVNGDTVQRIARCGSTTAAGALRRHDAYHALQSCGGLLVTGPTGTNVNDVCVLLVRGGKQNAR